MNAISKKNERKHHIKAVIYTVFVVGLLAAAVMFSGQAANLGSQLKGLISPEKTEAPAASKTPVAMLDKSTN